MVKKWTKKCDNITNEGGILPRSLQITDHFKDDVMSHLGQQT